MEPQALINIVFAALGALGGFVLKAVWDGLRELRDADHSLADKVQKIEVLVAGHYIKKDDFDKTVFALFEKLDRIDAKLDQKANKSDCPHLAERRQQ